MDLTALRRFSYEEDRALLLRRAARGGDRRTGVCMKNRILFSALFLIVSSIGVSAEETRPLVDATARTAIISAYEPEWVELRAALPRNTSSAGRHS